MQVEEGGCLPLGPVRGGCDQRVPVGVHLSLGARRTAPLPAARARPG